MADIVTTTFMNLTLPLPGQRPGPTYASDINTALTAVDSHDHTSTKGKQVPTAGLNIDADFNIQHHNLTNANAIQLDNLVSNPGTTNTLYQKNGAPWYTDNAGAPHQITGGVTVPGTNDQLVTSDGAGALVAESSTLNATGLNLAVPLRGGSGPLKLSQLSQGTAGTKTLSTSEQENVMLAATVNGVIFGLPALQGAVYIVNGYPGVDCYAGTAAQIAAGHGGANGDISCPSGQLTMVVNIDGTKYRKLAQSS